MQEPNQKLTGFATEIRLISGWVWAFAVLGFLTMQYLFNVVVARQPDAPPAWARPVLGLSVGLVVALYLLLVGYISRDFKLVAAWAWVLAALGFVCMQFVFNVIVPRQADAPPSWVRILLGLLVGLIVTCYLLLVGYVNRDSRRPGNHPVFHSPPARGRQLPPVRTRRAARFQFLSPMQLQVEPQLSAMPADGAPGGHVLPLLWNSTAGPN